MDDRHLQLIPARILLLDTNLAQKATSMSDGSRLIKAFTNTREAEITVAQVLDVRRTIRRCHVQVALVVSSGAPWPKRLPTWMDKMTLKQKCEHIHC